MGFEDIFQAGVGLAVFEELVPLSAAMGQLKRVLKGTQSRPTLYAVWSQDGAVYNIRLMHCSIC